MKFFDNYPVFIFSIIGLIVVLYAVSGTYRYSEEEDITWDFEKGSWLDVEAHELVDGNTVNYYDSLAANKYGSPNGLFYSYELVSGDTIWIVEMNSGTNYPGLLKSWSAEHDSPAAAAEYLFELYDKYEEMDMKLID